MAQYAYNEPGEERALSAKRDLMLSESPSFSLMFHDVVENADWDSSGFAGGANARYKLNRIEFERHLDAICSVASSRAGVRPALTFDDGGVSAHTVIAACLEERRLRGYFFIATDRMGLPGFVDQEQIRDLHRRGHIVGSHSCSHVDRISHCSREQISHEWVESVRVLSEVIGEPVVAASVPGGFYSRQVAECAAAAGVRRLFTSDPVTKIRLVDGCEIVGRYIIQRSTTPEWSASIAELRIVPRLRQVLLWELKRLAKAAGGRAYIKLRRKILNH